MRRNILTTLIAITLIDKVGRKPLLLVGSSGMAITLGTMAFIFGTATQVDFPNRSALRYRQRLFPRRTTADRGRAGLSVTQSQAVKTFDELFGELGERARTRPAGSGTVAALDGGVHGIGKKILEEAGEVWLAAEHESDNALAGEISQLLYWTQVLMVSRGLSLDDVYRKL